MCGRFFLSDEVNIAAFLEKLSHRYDQQKLDLFRPGEITPGMVAITYDSQGYQLMRWNYRLFGRSLINTRVESLADKDYYREDFSDHRCIIIASGFYEWDEDHNRYYLQDDEKLLFLAGIYQKTDDLSGFSIITRRADTTGHIHQRVPVVLDRKQSLDYIAGKMSAEKLSGLSKAFIIEPVTRNETLF